MPFVPATNVAQCELIFTLHGQRCQNTLYYTNGNLLTAGDLGDIGGFLLTEYTSSVVPYLSPDYALIQCEVTDLSDETAPSITVVLPAPVAGGGTGPALPGQNALCVSLRSGQRGRSSRGRNYVSGIPEADSAGGLVTQDWANNVRTGYDNLRNLGGDPGGYSMVVVSRMFKGNWRVAAQVLNVVSVVVVDLAVDSQNRRGVGRGR